MESDKLGISLNDMPSGERIMIKGRTTVYNNITSVDKISKIEPKNIELMNGFLDYLTSINRSPNTIDGYKSDILIFYVWNEEYNDNKYFVDLTKRDIAKFQKHTLSEWGWSSNRLARVKSSLNSMSLYIENILDDEIENFRPIIRKIETPVREPIREKTILTDDEVDSVLNKLVRDKKYQIACVFALAAFGGARKSELLRYKYAYFTDENIMQDAFLYKTPEKIQTKGRGVRGKELTKYTLVDFKKYYDLWMNEREKSNLLDNEYLFINPKGNTLSVDGLTVYSRTISKYLGRPFYLHSLRHQLCTRLFKLGLPSNIIQEYFGWSSAEMLTLYNDTNASDDFGKFFTPDGIKGL